MDLWHQASDILALALEHAPTERIDFVRQACGGNDALRAEVESLLFYHDQADTLLETPAALHLLHTSPGSMLGRRVGSYRLTREIGQGGMSVLYLGERDDGQFRKQTAIKMLKAGVHSEEILQRFANERQTLAALDHPNIVKLLDGGSTPEGWPYLIMEYVQGLPIDEFCRSRELTTKQRLDLFLQVCAAVQYAHRNQVIHRDLKPGNILITAEGVPRLLDFGIAKLLNPELQHSPLDTSTGWRPMTVEYASPEQVHGQPLSPASDIYSLGVLLFELLVGQRPFDRAHCSRQELERMICEQEPERPSRIARRLKGRLHAPTPLPNRDLDNIVLKALRKRPEERYPSASDFAQDIERYLAGRPVLARRPGPVYRSVRFVRRHKEAIATAAMVLALAAATGAWWLHGAHNNATVSSHLPAPVPVRRSVAVWGFQNLSGRPDTAWLSTALSQALAAELAAGEELRIIPAATVARTKSDQALPDGETIPRPALDRLRKNLGSDYIVLGSYRDLGPAAGGQTRVDVRIESTATAETTAAVSETGNDAQVLDLALRTGARLRERFGKSTISATEAQQIRAAFPANPAALRLYSQALARRDAFDALGARDLLLRAAALDPSGPLIHSALAATWRTLGYGAKAAAEGRQALDLAGGLSREDHLSVEAGLYEAASNWPQAVKTYQVLASLFPDSPDYALSLAGAQSLGGQGKEALETLGALARSGLLAPEDPRIDLASATAGAVLGDSKLRRDAAARAATKADRQGARLLAAQARVLECRALANLGENDRADAECQAAHRSFAEAGDRGGLARSLHAMAEVPLNQGDLVRAGSLYRQALALMREIGDRQGTATELVNLGLVLGKQGDFAAAHKMYAESLENYKQAGDQNGIAVVTGNLGNLFRAEGKLPEALANYQRVLALSNQLGHRSSAALALSAIGDVLMDEGDLPAAGQMYQQSLAIEQEIGEKSYAAERTASIGELLAEQGHTDQAIQLLHEALQSQEQLGKRGSAAEARLALSELECDLGRPAEAEPLIRSALATFHEQHQRDNEISAHALLSRALLAQARMDEADAALHDALMLAKQGSNFTTRQFLALDSARLLSATNHFARAEQVTRQVMAEASQSMVRLRLEAELMLAQIAIKRNAPASRKKLENVAQSARSKGFERIARKASAAL